MKFPMKENRWQMYLNSNQSKENKRLQFRLDFVKKGSVEGCIYISHKNVKVISIHEYSLDVIKDMGFF